MHLLSILSMRESYRSSQDAGRELWGSGRKHFHGLRLHLCCDTKMPVETNDRCQGPNGHIIKKSKEGREGGFPSDEL